LDNILVIVYKLRDFMDNKIKLSIIFIIILFLIAISFVLIQDNAFKKTDKYNDTNNSSSVSFNSSNNSSNESGNLKSASQDYNAVYIKPSKRNHDNRNNSNISSEDLNESFKLNSSTNKTKKKDKIAGGNKRPFYGDDTNKT